MNKLRKVKFFAIIFFLFGFVISTSLSSCGEEANSSKEEVTEEPSTENDNSTTDAHNHDHSDGDHNHDHSDGGHDHDHSGEYNEDHPQEDAEEGDEHPTGEHPE